MQSYMVQTGRETRRGRLEGWKAGRMEGWKSGRLEGWKAGRLDAANPTLVPK
jgi:hypothetical protein